MDVLEHIDRKQENIFMKNIVKSLSKDGILILSTPSIYSQKFTSRENKKSHINCKSDIELKNLCLKYFRNVFYFLVMMKLFIQVLKNEQLLHCSVL